MSEWVEEKPGLWSRDIDGGLRVIAGSAVPGATKFFASAFGLCISSSYHSIEAAKRGAERAIRIKCAAALRDVGPPAGFLSRR